MKDIERLTNYFVHADQIFLIVGRLFLLISVIGHLVEQALQYVLTDCACLL